MIPGALAVIAGAAQGGTGDKFERASLVKEDHTKGSLPQNGTVTSGNFGSRWCLLVQPKLKAGVRMCP
jgi:hypothetical protein